MRVLLTTDTIGGVWTFTRELTEGLLNEGHAVALVSFGRMPSREQQVWVDGKTLIFSDRFRYVPSAEQLEWMQNNDLAGTVASSTLLELVGEFEPDLIHSSQFCFGSLPTGIPRLVTAHSDVLSWADACRSGELDPSPWLERYNLLVQTGLNGADAVVAPTRHMLSSLKQHFTFACETYVIPNGRTVDAARDGEPRLRQAVSVGRLWDEAKSVSTLLEVNSPVPISLAGEAQFEEASASTPSSGVETLGVLAEDELLTLFRRSSAYIATSIYEPFGLAPLEAALCGCAIIARDIPTLHEVWGDAAIYFRTAGELEQRLAKLFTEPAFLDAARTAAKHRAEKFTAERMTASYVVAYERLMQRRKQVPRKHEELAFDAA